MTFQVPQEVIEKLMENKRLYHIILQNYPDLVTRRRSEANLNVDTPLAEAAIEPAILPIEIRAKKPKISESENHDRKHSKDGGDGKPAKEAGESKVDANGIPSNKSNPNISQDKSKQATPAPAPGWLRQISTITTTDHHYLRDMPLYRNTMMHRGAMMSIPRYRLKASSLPDMYRNSMESLDSLTDDEMVSALFKTLIITQENISVVSCMMMMASQYLSSPLHVRPILFHFMYMYMFYVSLTI